MKAPDQPRGRARPGERGLLALRLGAAVVSARDRVPGRQPLLHRVSTHRAPAADA